MPVDADAVYSFMSLMLEFLHNVALEKEAAATQADPFSGATAAAAVAPSGPPSSANMIAEVPDDAIVNPGDGGVQSEVILPPTFRSSNFTFEMPQQGSIRSNKSMTRLTAKEQPSVEQEKKLSRLGKVAEMLGRQPRQQHHFWPFDKFLSPWTMGMPFLRNCRYGVMQFVLLQGLCSVASAILEHLDVFNDGEWTNPKHSRTGERSFPLSGYAFVMPVRIVSQLVAMYCLVMFQ